MMQESIYMREARAILFEAGAEAVDFLEKADYCHEKGFWWPARTTPKQYKARVMQALRALIKKVEKSRIVAEKIAHEKQIRPNSRVHKIWGHL